MGLFDSLKKGIEAVAKEVDLHKDDLTKELEKYAEHAKSAVEGRNNDISTRQFQSNDGPTFKACSVYPYGCDRSEYIDDIIMRNFSAYDIQRNVSPSILFNNVHPKAYPIQYLIYNNGVPRVAVLVMNVASHGGINVRATDEACRLSKVNVMHLYHEYENAEKYIVDKINEKMN